MEFGFGINLGIIVGVGVGVGVSVRGCCDCCCCDKELREHFQGISTITASAAMVSCCAEFLILDWEFWNAISMRYAVVSIICSCTIE